LRKNEAFVADRGERRGIGQNRLFKRTLWLKRKRKINEKCKKAFVFSHFDACSSVSKSNHGGPNRAAATMQNNKTIADSMYNWKWVNQRTTFADLR
jgi:hypothetical protein